MGIEETVERDYAEDVNYWKTSRTSADEWLDKAKREIRKVGGQIIGVADVTDDESGRAAFCLAFCLQGERYQIKWPVLQSKTSEFKAARIQAATALFYDVKSTCVKMKFLGARIAFLAHWILPNGQTPAEASTQSLLAQLPHLLTATAGPTSPS